MEKYNCCGYRELRPEIQRNVRLRNLGRRGQKEHTNVIPFLLPA